jgi:hypothetical protein
LSEGLPRLAKLFVAGISTSLLITIHAEKGQPLSSITGYFLAEVGKVTLKSNGDEALNDEFLLKCNGDEALNDVFQ